MSEQKTFEFKTVEEANSFFEERIPALQELSQEDDAVITDELLVASIINAINEKDHEEGYEKELKRRDITLILPEELEKRRQEQINPVFEPETVVFNSEEEMKDYLMKNSIEVAFLKMMSGSDRGLKTPNIVTICHFIEEVLQFGKVQQGLINTMEKKNITIVLPEGVTYEVEKMALLIYGEPGDMKVLLSNYGAGMQIIPKEKERIFDFFDNHMELFPNAKRVEILPSEAGEFLKDRKPFTEQAHLMPQDDLVTIRYGKIRDEVLTGRVVEDLV